MSSLSQIGQYRLESSLGAGAWTETYHAYDVVLRRPVAFKLLHPGRLPAGKDYRGFLALAQKAAELVHPRIAWVWETGETEGKPYIVERFVGGASLAAHLGQAGPLPWDRALKALEQIAQAIEFAEERQWVHGRVTPHNILLSADHGAVLSDYGLVNAIRQFLPEAPPTLYDAAYLSPEVLQGQPASSRADQYALACTLVETLSGKNPFEAPSLDEILVKKTSEIVQPLLPLESAPIQAGEVIERALHPEPSARFDNALDFISALDRAVRVSLTDVTARAQHEEHVRRWREAEEKHRLEAEEAARLAALEQARREIQEQARIQAEKAVADFPFLTGDERFEDTPTGDGLPPEPPQAGPAPVETPATPARRSPGSRRKTTKRANWPRLWPVYTAVLIVVLGLGGFWLSSRQGGRQPAPPTATPSPTQGTLSTAQPAVLPPTSTASLIPSRTPAPTSTPRPSATPSRTQPASPTPSQTPGATQTNTPRPNLPTITPDRLDREGRFQGG